jgi:integrase/recombinase XerC
MPRRLTTGRLPEQQAVVGKVPDLGTAVEWVATHWRQSGTHSDQTLDRMTETIHRFTDRLRAQEVAQFGEVTRRQAHGFITAPVSGGVPAEVATRHARRTAVRTLYRTLRGLGEPVGDPTLDIQLPPRGLLVARPLTDDEVTLCRARVQMTAQRSAPMRSVAWALGEATAISSEITTVRLVDVDDPRNPGWVRLPGTRRHDPGRCR